MRSYLLIAAAAAALAAPLPSAYAQSKDAPQSKEALALAQKLVVRSGLAEQLKSLPKQFEQELAQARGQMPDEMLAALNEAARESFRPAVLQQDVVRILAAKMPAADMKRAIAWLETGIGKRVTRAEELASGSMTPEAVQAYAEGLKSAPPSERRTKLIAELITVTKGVEHGANMVEGVALGIAMGMDGTQPVQKRQGLRALQSQLRKAMPPEQIREAMGAMIPTVYGYTYRDVSDADLAAYVEYSRSPAGARYNEAVITAFTEAMLRASMRMGPVLEKALQKKPV